MMSPWLLCDDVKCMYASMANTTWGCIDQVRKKTKLIQKDKIKIKKTKNLSLMENRTHASALIFGVHLRQTTRPSGPLLENAEILMYNIAKTFFQNG